MIGVPHIRVGVVGRAMQLVGNHMHFCAIQEYSSKNCTQLRLMQFLD